MVYGFMAECIMASKSKYLPHRIINVSVHVKGVLIYDKPCIVCPYVDIWTLLTTWRKPRLNNLTPLSVKIYG